MPPIWQQSMPEQVLGVEAVELHRASDGPRKEAVQAHRNNTSSLYQQEQAESRRQTDFSGLNIHLSSSNSSPALNLKGELEGIACGLHRTKLGCEEQEIQINQATSGHCELQGALSSPSERSECATQQHEEPQQETEWGVVRVGAVAPHRIEDADSLWLQLFGFAKGEVSGRTLRVCQGPDTDIKGLNEIISAASSTPSDARNVTFYAKNGDDLNLQVRARKVGAADSSVELQMRDPSVGPSQATELSNQHAELVLSATEPHMVEQVNPAFTNLFGWTEAQVFAQGLAIILSGESNGTRCINMLKMAREGASTKAQINTLASDGVTLCTSLHVSPILADDGTVSRVSFSFSQVDQDELGRSGSSLGSADGWDVSASSRNSSQSSNSSQTSSSGERRTKSDTPTVLDRAVSSHLKAMKAMRAAREQSQSGVKACG